MVEQHTQPQNANTSAGTKRSTAVQVLIAAWLLSIGVDFLLHGGLLARIYLKPSPFLLEPQQAFLRIPLGYLSFLVLTASLYWLIRKLDVRNGIAGFQLGLLSGLILWGAFVLGLYSISTIDRALAAAWWIGQSIELGIAGSLLAAVEGGLSIKRTWIIALMAVAACVVLTIVLQSVGWAPPMESV